MVNIKPVYIYAVEPNPNQLSERCVMCREYLYDKSIHDQMRCRANTGIAYSYHCEHVFHYSCINETTNCPLCKREWETSIHYVP